MISIYGNLSNKLKKYNICPLSLKNFQDTTEIFIASCKDKHYFMLDYYIMQSLNTTNSNFKLCLNTSTECPICSF